MSYFRGLLTGVGIVLLAYAIKDKDLFLIIVNSSNILINFIAERVLKD